MDATEFNTRRYAHFHNQPDRECRVRKLVSLVGTGHRVLDLGCLDGSIGALLIRNGNRVWGIDASQVAVPLAREKGVEAQVGDLNQGIGFPDATFDAVLAGEIIEHVADPDRFLSEIHRVLEPDGVLVLSTPNLAALGRRLLLLFNRNPHIEVTHSGNAAGHVRYFIRSTLCDLLKAHGFEVEVFTSDEINLTPSGSLQLLRLATMCPSLGRTLIVRARRT